MAEITCPYCDSTFVFDDYDYHDQGVLHQIECKECDMNFIFETSYIVFYDAQKASCLNGENHNFEPTFTFPVECSVMQCTTCGERKEPTAQEMNQIKKDREK